MNRNLRKLAVLVGCLLLAISMMWSQDGFNFDLAGDSGGTNTAAVVGWVLAFAVTTTQFVFSTNYNKLNLSLITFGVVAYVYSIYTNKMGIVHFQGASANEFGAWVLAFVMDGVPEPLIAWGLGESLSGDPIGNIAKTLGVTENKSQEQSANRPRPQHSHQKSQYKPKHRPAHLGQRGENLHKVKLPPGAQMGRDFFEGGMG